MEKSSEFRLNNQRFICSRRDSMLLSAPDEKFGVRSSEFGVRGSEFGVRSSEFGVRSSEFGVRSQLRPPKLQFSIFFALMLMIAPVVMQAQVSLQLTPSNYNGFNISCFGKNDGSIDLTVSGGVAPYQIVWSTGDSIEDLSNIPAGYYRVTVQDSDSIPNAAEAEITLSEPRSVKIMEDVHTYPNQYNISVFGACNGILSVSAEDGVPPYSWMWTDSITATVCRQTKVHFSFNNLR